MNSAINRRPYRTLYLLLVFCLILTLCGCRKTDRAEGTATGSTAVTEAEENKEEKITAAPPTEATTEEASLQTGEETGTTAEEPESEVPEDRTISWDPNWEYADFSEIHDSGVKLYYSHAPSRKNMVVAVNAGHGTTGGESVKTLSHPDGTGKVNGGTNGEGAVYSMAISSGMEFDDGTPEASAVLSLALLLKDALLEEGFDVLMIREEADTRLDNIARTVFANNNADCHIALHYDSTDSDKGAFYVAVPDVASYRHMEPVASHWKEHHALGEALIKGLDKTGVPIFKGGSIELDLIQTSYSTIPSVDLELGDRASDYSGKTQERLAEGIVKGLSTYKDR